MSSTRPWANLAVSGLVLGVGACTSWAPPMRSTHYGTPGRRPPGQMEIGGGVAGVVNSPTSGGPHLGIPIAEPLAIEAGADLDVGNGWGVGFAGLRYTPLNQHQRVRRVAVDTELGGGLGVGGRNHGNCDPADESTSRTAECWTGDDDDWRSRLAGGGYIGTGLGIHVARWSSFFVRARYQWTSARSVPLTHWLSTVLGVQFSIVEQVHIHAAGGYGLIATKLGHWDAPILDLGLTFTFDVPKSKRGKAARSR